MISTAEIQKAVAAHYGLTVEDLRGPSRLRGIAHPRQDAMYLARTITNRSWGQIGQKFGRRDHTTVMHGYRAASARIEQDHECAKALWWIAIDLAGKAEADA